MRVPALRRAQSLSGVDALPWSQQYGLVHSLSGRSRRDQGGVALKRSTPRSAVNERPRRKRVLGLPNRSRAAQQPGQWLTGGEFLRPTEHVVKLDAGIEAEL